MPRVDPFYADDDVDAVRLISKQEQRREIEEGVVIDAPEAGQIAVRLAGSSRTIPVDPLVGTKLNRGDHVKLMRSRQNRWIVIGAFSVNSTTGSTDGGASNVTNNILGAPASIAAYGILGGILVVWENPGAANLVFEIEYASDTAGTGAVIKRVAGGTYLIDASAGTTRYAHVRAVDGNWNRSGWSDWVGATAGGAVTDLPAQPGCRVYNNAAISINNTTWTPLTFNSEVFDTDNMHSTSSNTSRITFNTAGVYAISGNVEFNSNTTGDRGLSLYLNGATFISVVRYRATSAFDTILNVSHIGKFSVNDYIELQAWQNSGGALNVNSGPYTPYFAAQRLSA